jgi:C1A family cysteine protease/uncharacterized protein YjdB
MTVTCSVPVFAANGAGDGGSSGSPKAETIVARIPHAASPGGSSNGYIDPGINTDKINDADYPVIPDGLVHAMATLPASFSWLDGSHADYVSPVRDQGMFGVCWAFSALASAGGSLVSGGIESSFTELSPKQLTYAVYNKDTFYAGSGSDAAMNSGGNSYMATAAMSKWFGPVKETTSPYPPSSAQTDPSPLTTLAKYSASDFHLKEMLQFPSPYDSSGVFSQANVNAVKNALQTYGPLATSFYADESIEGEPDPKTDYYSDAPNYSYYCTDIRSVPNHGIAVVGWDDDFSKTKFSNTPAGNGAWLIQNSWADDWGDNGYFWMSYYDKSMSTSQWFSLVSNTDYDFIHYYDELGYIGAGFSNDSPSIYIANVFDVDAADSEIQSLNAVSVFTPDPGMSYEISVYKDPVSGPASGTLVDISTGSGLTITGNEPFAGYHTIGIDANVYFTSADTYSVVVKLKEPSGNIDYVPVESSIDISEGAGKQDNLTIAKGQSYYSTSGSIWTDLYDLYKTNAGLTGLGNVNIKSFTDVAEVKNIALDGKQTVTYGQGKSFDYTKGKLLVTYDDGITESLALNAKGVNVSYDFSVASAASPVTVSYHGAKTTFNVNVTPWIGVGGVSLPGIPKTYKYKAADKTHTLQLTANISPANATEKTVTWSASGPATISKTGLLTFNGTEGIVSVKVSSAEIPAKYYTADIKVVKNVTNIRTPLSTIYLKRGSSYKLPVAVDDGKKTISAGLTYKSANKKVVTVSGGKLKASAKIKKQKKTTVTIKAANGKTKKITVYVVPSAKTIKKFSVTGMPGKLKAGATKQLTVRIKTKGATGVKVTYASSKSKVVSVDKAGKLTAKKKGTAYITVKAGSKKIRKKIKIT